MANNPCLCHINIGGVDYEIKDSTARALINALETQVNNDYVSKNELANNNDIVRKEDIHGTLLWYNESSLSDFIPQLVPLENLSSYKKIIIRYKHVKFAYITSTYITIQYKENAYFTLSIYDDGKTYSRNLFITSEGIDFRVGKENSNEGNHALIPLEIYGLKE